MKRTILMLLLALLVCSSISAQDTSARSLLHAFEKISLLDGVQTVSRQEIEQIMGAEIGDCKGLVHGNASHRDAVLDILSHLPKSLLYSEHRTSTDKITRVYIEQGATDRMLYTFVGWGGNDLVVLLYSGGDIAKYRMVGDSINE